MEKTENTAENLVAFKSQTTTHEIEQARKAVAVARSLLKELIAKEDDYRLGGFRDGTERYLFRIGQMLPYYHVYHGLTIYMQDREKAVTHLGYCERNLQARIAEFDQGKLFVDRVNFAKEYLKLSHEERAAYNAKIKAEKLAKKG